MHMHTGTASLVAALLVVATASPASAAPPDTMIDAGSTPDTAKILPSQVAVFYFSTADPSDGFECQVDGGGYTDCTSPQTYQLPAGSHLFEVRATQGLSYDQTPALSQWIVRNVPCEQASAEWSEARSNFFKYKTRKGYKKEALQRAIAEGKQAKAARLRAKIEALTKLIRKYRNAMAAAEAEQDQVC